MKCSIPSCRRGEVFRDQTGPVRLVLGHDVDPNTASFWRKGDPCGHATSRCEEHRDTMTVCRSCCFGTNPDNIEPVVLAIDVNHERTSEGVTVPCPMCLATEGGHYYLYWRTHPAVTGHIAISEWDEVYCSKCDALVPP